MLLLKYKLNEKEIFHVTANKDLLPPSSTSSNIQCLGKCGYYDIYSFIM